MRDPETGLCVEPDEVIKKIDEAYVKYKMVMSKQIVEQLSLLNKYYEDFSKRLLMLEQRKGNPVLAETEKLTVRMDNLEDKLKGQFKGHSPSVNKKSEAVYGDPYKKKRK